MKLSQAFKNKRTVSYIFGFSALTILLVHNLNGLYTRYSNSILREVGDRQLMATRTLALKLSDKIDYVADDLAETAGIAALLLNNNEMTKSVSEKVFEEFIRKTTSDPDTRNDFLISMRWICREGKEQYILPLNGDSLSSLESEEWSSLVTTDSDRLPSRILGPHISPAGLNLLWVVVPVRIGDADSVAGFYAAEVNVRKLVSNTLLAIDPTGDLSDMGILDGGGNLLYSQNHADMTQGNVIKPADRCFDCHVEFDLPLRALKVSDGWGNWELAGHTSLLAFSAIDIAGDRWTVTLAFPESSLAGLLAPFSRHFYSTIFVTIGLLGLLASLLVDLRKKRFAAEEQAKYLQQRTALLREKKEMNHRYIELVEHANDAIYILQENQFVLVNKAFEKMHGYKSEELLSPDFDLLSIVAPESREYVTTRGERKRRGEDLESTYDFKVLRKDGLEIDVEASVTYIQFQGKPAVQGVLRDITAKKRYEEEMKQKNVELEMANKELRELDQMKDNFISTISHELRTPLTSIKGSLDILLKGMLGELDEKKDNILKICHRNSERLIVLVNNLLELQNLEGAQSELHLEPIQIEDLIPGLIEKANSDSTRKGIHLRARIDANGSRRIVMADQSRISNAISNLLSNAIKFSDRGTVLVEVTHLNGEVRLSVSDEGIGVSEGMKDRIFDKFTQVDGSKTRKRGGTGMGLTLARLIVERHGGRMWVESREGFGSKFSFSLPCKPANGDEEGGQG